MSPIPHHHDPGPRRRYLVLDLLRGFALVVIIVDHLVLFPSIYMFVTGQGLLWVTAAEAFFFISGLMIGLVRGREIERIGFKAVTRKVWERAGKLYIATVILTLTYTLLALALSQANIEGSKGGLLMSTSMFDIIWRTLTLTYTYGWSDFLPYYVIYLALAPAVLWLLRRGKWLWILLASITVWVIPSVVPGFDLPGGMNWQIYFFTGAIAGYHFQDILDWWAGHPAPWRRISERVIVITGALLMLASGAIVLLPNWFASMNNIFLDALRMVDGDAIYRYLLTTNRTGLLRPLVFAVVFTALALVVRRYQHAIKHTLGWLLIPLGQNSLYVYIVQGVIAFTIPLLALPKGFWINSLVSTAAILVVWYLVRKQFLFKIIPR